jgi:hypothetical protein
MVYELTSAEGPKIESSTGKKTRPLARATTCTLNNARKKYLENKTYLVNT